MTCPHLEACALFPHLDSPFLGIWTKNYCDNDHPRCVRFQKGRAGEIIPATLLPNGKELRHSPEQARKP